MLHRYFLLFLVSLIINMLPGIRVECPAQTCGCTITQVQSNTVTPCDLVIGPIINVATTNELYNAINQVNANGGNMTVLLADGTYPIASPSWYPYITASNVVFRSASGNRDAVILTGTGMKSVSPNVENVIYFVGDNNTIADLTIRDVGNHGIAVEGDSLFVHNVRIQNTYEQMIKGTAGGDGADYGLVQCSLFEYPAGIGPQFYIGGLDIHKGDHWTVRDNVFKDIASPSGSVAEHAVHFWNDGSDQTIERNMIINCDRGIGLGLGSSPNTGGMIRNNMIYNDGGHPFHDVGIGLETSPGTRVYNNTIYIQYQNAIEYRFPATTGVDIVNNLTNKTIKSRDGAQATLATNQTSAWETWFIDAAAGDLHLLDAFPAVVDQGTDLSPDVLVDIDQLSRPQGSGYDIGAHEFPMPTSLTPAKAPLPVSIFPNPARESFTIQSFRSGVHHLVVTDLLGHLMFNQRMVTLPQGVQVDTRSWDPGIYVCRLIGENGAVVVRKVMITEE
ncbi:MAG: T9SS type A sorting domain-containing protein [Saprospiraceae bacterium]|nr:T9SS type A sorting domain-containing protein [Saprospiraceae bacterium]